VVRGSPRQLLSSLTVRGRGVLAGGVVLLLTGMVLGERPLVQLAVFVLALPVVAGLAVVRARFRLTVRRAVTPARVPRGGSTGVRLELTDADGRPGGLCSLSEQVPAELGGSPRFIVERLGSGVTTTLQYRVTGSHRGRHVLGPLRLRLMDPFGLVERNAVGTDSTTLLVVPRVRPLGPAGPAGGPSGGGEGSRRTVAVHGEDDVGIRVYRQGDDLRKVHWRATAHTGELMVRLEERPWRAQATLLLDTRARAHLLAPRLPAGGEGAPAAGPPGDDCPPPDTLEWLVEAAASIGTAMARRGAVLRTVTDTGELLATSGPGRPGSEDLLDLLAGVRASRAAGLATGVEQLCRAAGDGPVICLLGAVGPDDVGRLVRARSGPTTDLVILADLASWVHAGGRTGRRSLSAASISALTRAREDAATLLRSAGWRVAVARADRSVAQVWAELGAPAPSPEVGPATAGAST
jgi:uncharacterized protein (DUF58 family)